MTDGAANDGGVVARFKTTRWSLIETARSDSARSRAALEQLCADYRPPVLAYVRTHGFSIADAEDITQEFFARFVERAWYAGAEPTRGRFRALVLTALQRFMSDYRAQTSACKRGGGHVHVTLDEAAGRLATVPSAEDVFARAWMSTVLGRAVRQLEAEWQEAGKSAEFEGLVGLLDGRVEGAELDQLTTQLGLRRNTLSVHLHRLRSRLRQITREELLRTVSTAADLAVELAELRSEVDSAARH
jgi:RNA polymerase sigma-70 factor (ECF subfamily)